MNVLRLQVRCALSLILGGWMALDSLQFIALVTQVHGADRYTVRVSTLYAAVIQKKTRASPSPLLNTCCIYANLQLHRRKKRSWPFVLGFGVRIGSCSVRSVCAYVMSGCSGSLSTPATPTHHTTPHMVVTNRWRQLVERITRLVRLWPLKRRPGIALGATSAGTAYVFGT